MAKTSDFVRRIRRAGFYIHRHGKRHDLWIHADGRRVTVPRHPSAELPTGTYRAMLRDAGLTDEE